MVRALCCVVLSSSALAFPAAASAEPPSCSAEAPGEQTDPARNQFKVGVEKRVAVCTAPSTGLDGSARAEKGSLRAEPTASGGLLVYYTASEPGEAVFSFRAVNLDGPSEPFYGSAVNTTPQPPVCTGGGGAFFDSGTGTATNTLTVGAAYFAPFYCSDPNNQDQVKISVTRAPTLGSVQIPTLSDGSSSSDIVYTPAANGSDTFSIQATDVDGASGVVSASSTNVGGPTVAPVVSPSPPPGSPPAPSPVARTPAVTVPIVFGLGKLPGSLRVDGKGNVTVSVTGRAGTRGTATLVADTAAASARKKAALTLGKRAFRMPASGTAKVKIRLSAKALRTVKKRKAVRSTLTVTGGTRPSRKRVTVRPAKKKR